MAALAVQLGGHVTNLSMAEARSKYNLNTSHSFQLVSETELSEETIGKVCGAIVEWTIVMGSMPLRNAKFNGNLGTRVMTSMGSELRGDGEYEFFMRAAQRFVKADDALESLMKEHKISRFFLNGHNQFFDNFSGY
jgi:hypothetical protein